MASSGWQNEQNLYTYSSNITLVGNIRVDSITHNGTNLRVTGRVGFGSRGTSSYYCYYNYGVQEKPGNGSWTTIVGNGERITNGYTNDYGKDFDVTITNVSASATSYSFPVSFKACYNSGCSSTYWEVTKYWTITFGSSGTAPSGLYANNISTTWNSVSGTVGLTSYGSGGTNYGLELIVLTQPYTEGKPHRYSGIYNGSMSYTTTVDNNSTASQAGSITIKGCGLYYCGVWATNGTMTSRYQAGSVYTKPAPSQFSYTDPGGSGSKTYPVTFVGDTVNNNTTYDTASLTRTIRYKIDNGSWVYVDNETVALLDYATSFSVTVPAGSVATIEGWMTYHGGQSEVRAITLANTNTPVHLYGSVNDASEEVVHLYGSVNGRAKKIKKLYASVGGVAKKVFVDE